MDASTGSTTEQLCIADDLLLNKETFEDVNDLVNGEFTSTISRYKNRIKHVERSIDQNLKRGEELAGTCYSLLHSTELIAFDLLFAEYLYGNVTSEAVYDFIESCIHPKFDLSSRDPDEYQKALNYIESMHAQIKKSANSLINRDKNKHVVPSHTSDFVLYLKNKKLELERMFKLKQHEESPTEEPQEELPPLADINKKQRAGEPPQVLVKWLQDELKSSNEANPDSIELSCLIRSLAAHLSNISKLHDSIVSITETRDSLRTIDYSDVDIDVLHRSPFFKGVENSSLFLSKLHTALSSFESKLKSCWERLSQIQTNSLNEYNRNQAFLAEIQAKLDNLTKSISSQSAEANANKNAIESFVSLPENMPKVEKTDVYQQIRDRIARAMSTKKAGSDDARALQEQLDFLNHTERTRNEIFALISQQETMISFAKLKVKQTLELETRDSTNGPITDQIVSECEKLVHLINERLNDTNSGSANEHLTEIQRECMEAQRDLMQAFEVFDIPKDLDKQIELKKKKIEEAIKHNHQLSLEIGRTKLSLISVEDDIYRAQKELEARNMTSDTARKRLAMLTCPSCKKRVRNCILSTCGHPLCRQCLDEQEHKNCPVCKVEYTDKDIKNFVLQM